VRGSDIAGYNALGLRGCVVFSYGESMNAIFHLRRRFRYAATAALLCFLCVSAGAQQPTIRFVRNPDPAPDFKLTTLEGKALSLAEYKNRVVLLNFWATWCGPCRAEVPDLVELQNKYKDQLQIIGLVVDDEDQDAIKKFAAEFGINYPVALATDAMRLEYGGIPALPTSFVLDAQGRIVQKHEGLRDPVLYEVEIRALLGLPIGDVKVETFEDTGQILLKHADRATQLPGVDLSKLTPEQRTVALHKFNAEMCTCGCPSGDAIRYTLAQCRIWDRNCPVSKAATAKIIAALAAGRHAAADPPASEKPSSALLSPSPTKPTAPEKPRE
jgi:thiol-disulfide isomerase/thioredoxin